MQQYDAWDATTHKWIGMAEGNTPQEAREMINKCWPVAARNGLQIILTPFYACGLSVATYEALIGITHPENR